VVAAAAARDASVRCSTAATATSGGQRRRKLCKAADLLGRGELDLLAWEAKLARDLPRGERDGRISLGKLAFSEPRGGLTREIAKLYFRETVCSFYVFFIFFRYNSIYREVVGVALRFDLI
jgi:hypothetical protein